MRGASAMSVANKRAELRCSFQCKLFCLSVSSQRNAIIGLQFTFLSILTLRNAHTLACQSQRASRGTNAQRGLQNDHNAHRAHIGRATRKATRGPCSQTQVLFWFKLTEPLTLKSVFSDTATKKRMPQVVLAASSCAL